ncbi:MAG: hypothetical protein LYZ66_02060 [Nitrososphaerales archaeon]|nr:hypothetical protein [Nitrososphaerales archaeon]
MNSRKLFVMGSALLLLSLLGSILVFVVSPVSIFTNPAEASVLLRIIDAVPTGAFFVGVALLVLAQLKQRNEQTEEL